MIFQVLLKMGQDRLSNEETVELLYQRVNIVASTQDIRHTDCNFVRVVGD